MSEYATELSKRPSQINEQLVQLPENIDVLAQELSTLEHRLGDVLIGDEMLTGDTLSVPQEVLVPVASQLRSANDRISILIAQTRSILQRLEL